MASTYSSSLSLQLMATGENASTWGDVTNTNLGTALEQSIASSTDVDFPTSADVTLTKSASNASQPYRYMRLNLTSTAGITTAQNLIIPTIQKVYIVKNNVAAAITIKTAAGTGIAVPSGKTMWVYADGVNVVDAVTTLTSLTLGSPLGIASGGTGLNTIGSNGQVLTVNGSSLSWITPSSPGTGTVTNVTIATGSTGLTVNSSTSASITGAGTITFGGTLGASSGGTGLTSAGTSGNVLVSNGSGWISSASGTGVTSFSGGSTGLSPFSATTGAITLGGILGVGYGGTGSSSKNFVDLSTTQTVAGAKTWSNTQVMSAGINTTDLEMTGSTSPTINMYYNSSSSTKKSIGVTSINELAVFNTAFSTQILRVSDSGDLTITGTGYSPSGWVNTSDYRGKTNITDLDASSAISRVQAIRPVTYTLLSNGQNYEGFIAHELAEVVPSAVVGEKDAVNEDGTPKYQGVDASRVIPVLVAAIKELKAEIDALKATIPV